MKSHTDGSRVGAITHFPLGDSMIGCLHSSHVPSTTSRCQPHISFPGHGAISSNLAMIFSCRVAKGGEGALVRHPQPLQQPAALTVTHMHAQTQIQTYIYLYIFSYISSRAPLPIPINPPLSNAYIHTANQSILRTPVKAKSQNSATLCSKPSWRAAGGQPSDAGNRIYITWRVGGGLRFTVMPAWLKIRGRSLAITRNVCTPPSNASRSTLCLHTSGG